MGTSRESGANTPETHITSIYSLTSTSLMRKKKQRQGLVERKPTPVPEIRNAIERAERTERNTPDFRFTNSTLVIGVTIVQLLCPMDYTSSYMQDTRHMLSAFRWTVSKLFWMLRVDERLSFEMGLLEKADFAKWQPLCLKLMSLVCDRKR